VVARPRSASDPAQSQGGPEHGGALYCLSYVSTQTQSMSETAMVELLTHCRAKNADLGITGLLLHRDDSFFQILEGGEEEVRSLFEKISADERHERVEVLSEGPTSTRDFMDWQMAFIDLDGQDFSALPGFSDVLKNTPESREFLRSLSRSKKLAMLFSILD